MLQTVCSTSQAGIHALLDHRPDRLLSSLTKLNKIVWISLLRSSAINYTQKSMDTQKNLLCTKIYGKRIVCFGLKDRLLSTLFFEICLVHLWSWVEIFVKIPKFVWFWYVGPWSNVRTSNFNLYDLIIWRQTMRLTRFWPQMTSLHIWARILSQIRVTYLSREI